LAIRFPKQHGKRLAKGFTKRYSLKRPVFTRLLESRQLFFAPAKTIPGTWQEEHHPLK